MEMLKTLKSMQKKKGSDSGSDSDKMEGRSGTSIKNLYKLRNRVRKRPLRIVREYRARIMRELGVLTDREGNARLPWSYHDHSMRQLPRFKHMTGLWRCDYAMGQLLHLLEEGQVHEAAATTVQIRKAILQTALDNGSWNQSHLLLPWDDPILAHQFGGDEEELEAVHNYSRAMQDLRATHKKLEQPWGPKEGEQEGQQNRKEKAVAAAAKAAAGK